MTKRKDIKKSQLAANETEQQIEVVEQALSRTELFLEKNQDKLLMIIFGIVAVFSVYLAYNKLYLQSEEQSAQTAMFQAEQHFEKDSFNLAINGDETSLGFLQIIDEYGITKSANLSYYYAGISYLNLGDFDKAIEYLEDFDSDDKIVKSMSIGAIGDAYMEKDETQKAIYYYEKAAENNVNDFSTPIFLMKKAIACEKLKKLDEALKIYEEIKSDFAKTSQGRNADKYITKIKAIKK
ncbi:MAG: hypothetical protein B6I24_04860 [Bacteroidetes bacterium 4572_128]|nr:MAG: hypothetical protein B6I24_04860 [Bacteroidetes bacterium 4572_128]